MHSDILKISLFFCIIFQSACDITFKKKSSDELMTPGVINEHNMNNALQAKKDKKDKKIVHSNAGFNNNDAKIITSFYSNANNAIIRKDMIMHTELSKKQEKSIRVNKIIPRDIQVVPLPINLEKSLSPLALHLIRVQIGSYVVVMNVKNRMILAMINI